MPETLITQNDDAQTDAPQSAEPQNENSQVDTAPKQEKKSFSQEEVDAIVEKQLKREREKTKAAQKTDAERITDLENRLTASERKNAVTAANCNPTFAKFVMHEVGEMEGDFSENLAKFKAENPQYFTASNNVKFSSSPSLAGMGKAKNSNTIMNELLRKNRR